VRPPSKSKTFLGRIGPDRATVDNFVPRSDACRTTLIWSGRQSRAQTGQSVKFRPESPPRDLAALEASESANNCGRPHPPATLARAWLKAIFTTRAASCTVRSIFGSVANEPKWCLNSTLLGPCRALETGSERRPSSSRRLPWSTRIYSCLPEPGYLARIRPRSPKSSCVARCGNVSAKAGLSPITPGAENRDETLNTKVPREAFTQKCGARL
jgi:hypothetical protein